VKSNTEWKYWGEKDPLFGVAAWKGRDKGGANPWSEEDFIRLGELDWEDFRNRWQRFGLDNGHCIEIGCGAGRITRCLARDFKRVDATDISESMIKYARKLVGGTNVKFHLVENCQIPVESASATAVFSTHVFQHFDGKSDVLSYFQEISRALRPGGSMMIHIPLFTWPEGTPLLSKGLYRIAKYAQQSKADIKRLFIRSGKPVCLMRMSSYETGWLVSILTNLGFEEIELMSFATQSNNSSHPFVLAKKIS
jgi:ubiquinone/menaquinone biosynthesis C-methylase UbiE